MASRTQDLSRHAALRSTLPLVAALAFPATLAAQRYVDTGDAEHPRVQYADSTVSLNDRCIVRLRKLSTKVPPVYVNGRPIGFC